MDKNKIANWQNICISKEREFLLKTLLAGLDAIDLENKFKEKIKLKGTSLKMGEKRWNLDSFQNIYFLTLGKHSQSLVDVLQKLLPGKIAGHEIGGQKSEELKLLAEKITKDDLVICLVSGDLADILELEDKDAKDFYSNSINKKILPTELEILYKHIFQLSGRGLAKMLYPAHILEINLNIGGNPLASLGLNVLDNSTMYQAKEIIQKYNLGTGKIYETPKEAKYFKNTFVLELASNKDFFGAIKEYLNDYGENTKLNLPERFTQDEIKKARAGEIILSHCYDAGNFMDLLNSIKTQDTLLFIDSEGKGKIIDSNTQGRLQSLGYEITSTESLNETINDSFSIDGNTQTVPSFIIFYRS